MNFSDRDFELACLELQRPKTDDFEFFTEALDVQIYRKYDKISGLYEYKIWGSLPDCPPDICAAVYMDLEYRLKWDSYVKDLYNFEENGLNGVYWQVNFPWPMANRDYLYLREMREVEVCDQHYWTVLAKSYPFTQVPETSSVVRVDSYYSYMALETDGRNGSKAFMYYFDNPKGSIPTWLINWAAKTGVPGFLTQMRTACANYNTYLESK